MQVGDAKLKAQQQMLTAKGFYKGELDGIWGPKTIQAMKEFESSKKFAPGIPNNGLPLADRGPFPKGITIIKGLIWCPEMDVVSTVAKSVNNVETPTED